MVAEAEGKDPTQGPQPGFCICCQCCGFPISKANGGVILDFDSRLLDVTFYNYIRCHAFVRSKIVIRTGTGHWLHPQQINE